MIEKTEKRIIEVSKPTFSAVHGSQEAQQDLLEDLIRDNRSLKASELSYFRNLMASSTLGLGTIKDFNIYIQGKVYHYGNVESAARWLGRQSSNKIGIPSDYGFPGSPIIDIKFFWEKLLELLFFIYPRALDMAICMSREESDQRRERPTGQKVGKKID